jgi:excisionase family DNA binding protein
MPHSSYDQVVTTIKEYEGRFSTAYLSDLIGMRQRTIDARIRRGMLPARFDGYMYWISKQQAMRLVRENRPVIEKWPLKTELARRYDVSPQTIDYLCTRESCTVVSDALHRIHIDPESSQKICAILDTWPTRDVMNTPDGRWYSLGKLARDAAAYHARRGTKEFRIQTNRCYQAYWRWMKLNGLPNRRFSGNKKWYIPEEYYAKLIDFMQVGDAANYAGVSDGTIHNWIEKGILNHHKLDGDMNYLVSRTELRRTLVQILQDNFAKRLLRKYRQGENPVDTTVNFLDGVFDVNSNYWRELIHALRIQERSYRGIKKPRETMEEYIGHRTGWSKSRIHATQEIARLRDRWLIPLDNENDEGHSLVTMQRSRNAVDPFLEVHHIILSADMAKELEQVLDADEKDLVQRHFGFKGEPESLDALAASIGTSPQVLDRMFQVIYQKLAPHLGKYCDVLE